MKLGNCVRLFVQNFSSFIKNFTFNYLIWTLVQSLAHIVIYVCDNPYVLLNILLLHESTMCVQRKMRRKSNVGSSLLQYPTSDVYLGYEGDSFWTLDPTYSILSHTLSTLSISYRNQWISNSYVIVYCLLSNIWNRHSLIRFIYSCSRRPT